MVSLKETAARSAAILEAIATVIVGKDDILRQIFAGILAAGHILIEDYPGLAKTLTAKLLADCLGLQFRRIQFTPDLLPGDITGSFIFDQRSGEFSFRRGPLFTQLLLGDEINRATPKTQAALLESMQEAQVTVEGQTFPLEKPFIVIATQNPIDLEGTYPLPEAQLDRFIMRVAIGYPSPEEEVRILRGRLERAEDQPRLKTLITAVELSEMQAAMEGVFVEPSIDRYIVSLAQATRSDRRLGLGVSPRGAVALLKLARAGAVLRGRDYVTPDDVKWLAEAAFAHRVSLRPELWVSATSTREVIGDILNKVPAPTVESVARPLAESA